MTLRQPPPLERSLVVRRDDGVVVLLDGDAVVAEARPATVILDSPPAVSLDEAGAARERHVRGWSPEFGECFVCGDRSSGDGLGIRVGPVLGREPLHAAPWTPSESAPEMVWAAIDCPGAYAVGAEGRGEVVLGRMTARVLRVPEAWRAVRCHGLAGRRGRPQALRRHGPVRRGRRAPGTRTPGLDHPASVGAGHARPRATHLPGSEGEQEAAVFVVRREEVCGDALLDAGAGADLELLPQLPHAPLPHDFDG